MAKTTAEIEQKIKLVDNWIEDFKNNPHELTGMLPAVIVRAGELMKLIQDLTPKIIRGYDAACDKDSLHHWGSAIDIVCSDYKELKLIAKSLGWSQTDSKCSHPGHLEYIGERKIADFKSFKVGGFLEIMESKIAIEEQEI